MINEACKKGILIIGLITCINGFSAEYEVCFTPGQNCTQMIVNSINEAKNTINVQAYSFTSYPILNALAKAEERGVSVDILLDKSNLSHRYKALINYLESHSLAFLIDYKPAIAHNKVMIIDDNEVITGSFNFTKAAQERNAENVLIIDNKKLAQQYQNNFNNRKAQSIGLAQCYETRRCFKPK